MTKINILFLILILGSYLYPLSDYYKVSKVRIFINEPSEIQVMRAEGLVADKTDLHDNYFETFMDSIQISNLEKAGYQYEIIVDDVTKDYLERTRESREKLKLLKKPASGFGYGSMGGFYTLSEVEEKLDEMRLLYPHLITARDSIGASVEGRPLWAVKISDNPDVSENEPQVFYNALTHAREPQGMMVVLYFMFYLLENYGTDPRATYLIDNRELFFMPVVNPDGYAYNEKISADGGGMWRKNRKNNGDGSYGIDLNRNYGYKWGYDDIGSSPNTSSAVYRGPGRFSEPETQVIRDLCKDNNFMTAVNYHSYWNVVFSPFGYNQTQSPDSTKFINLIKFANIYNGYLDARLLPPYETYPTNGEVTDWMYGDTTGKNLIFGVLPEVGGNNDGFWPVPERIFPLAEENLYSNMVYAWGPGIIEDYAYLAKAEIYPTYGAPGKDSVYITAAEMNSRNAGSFVTASLYNSQDNLLDELELSSTDENKFFTALQVPMEEGFYYLRLKDSTAGNPFSIPFDKILKFTTAGPVILDSIKYTESASDYYVKTFLTNLSPLVTIKNASVRLVCKDPWVLPVSSEPRSLPDIQPGGSVSHTFPFIVQAIDSLFTGSFNFKVEVMSDGYVYWTDSVTTAITGINDQDGLPTAYNLEQNYPNPFNPVTKIKYEIPVSSLAGERSAELKVTLKIYDILGREVAVLLDEKKSPGVYEIEFDGTSLTSGIYLYRLQSGSFSETRKMVLIK